MIRWEQATYFPGQNGGPSFLVIPERNRLMVHKFPQPCPSRAPKGVAPTLGDPEVVRQTYVVGWEKTRKVVCEPVRYRVINLSNGTESPATFGSVREAELWAEERL